MNGYSTRDYILKGAPHTVAGVATNTVVSEPFAMTAEDSLRFIVRIHTTAITVVGSITAKVQENWADAAGWQDVGSQATAALTFAGSTDIQMIIDNTADQAQLPTAPLCRIVVSNTNAGDTVTIDHILVSRRF